MMRTALIALISCCLMQCIQGQGTSAGTGQAFDLGRLFGGRSGDPLWTLIDKNLPQVQQMIDKTKQTCMEKLGMKAPQRSLIRETRPTPKEKCLVECVLKGIKIMDNDSNRLNLRRVEELTSLVTQDNKLAIALGCSLAQICNRSISTTKPCEAAHQLNQCIGRQLETNRLKLHW